jgi:LacI family transcriptional regulator
MGIRQRRPTMVDVARHAGTSTAVVSYVLNGGPRQVSPQTRARVEAAIGELGYRRNPHAAALSAGRASIVGLIVPDSSNAFFGELSACIEAEARRYGMLTMLGNSHYEPGSQTCYERAFADLNCAASFVVGIGPDAGAEGRRIYVHAAPPRSDSPSVVFDDYAGALTAVRHLRRHGATDVDCFTGPVNDGPSGAREAGWRAATAGAGRCWRFPRDRVRAEHHMRELLREHRPRAVFATTDEHALACLRAAHRAGLRVPDDLLIVGFDGIVEARRGCVPVTTIALPLDELAGSAFAILAGWVREDDVPASRVLRGTLLIGATCGCTAVTGLVF